ncbi:MAG: TIGR02680 family protein [Lachnospiraceae bacterium]|nr:TIGR02680 family protein [Lachnospiraceae bacterium]
MNSKWQANKIGLINFWYYDEQEFPFVKGRMLLRGSNGSGKSVTMQSVVPLLLDGNMSPERLDPFGSRDRKMNSYLLEEDDGREERTGYLYMEFKRVESEAFLTIGMGIRARRGKPLDKWYFSLSDGRRVGKDFYLYRQTDERVTLSKKELENRIADGGRVFERQADYMEYVNRQIFGFETVEEYKELIDLLIQLRTPKLSKDFKPSVVNDILSNSLQPLSDDDLRPMSEAIENMDNMNMNLKTLQEGKQAAEKINRVLDKYNRLCLFEKAGNYEENEKQLTALLREEKEQEQGIREHTVRAEELERERILLDAKKEAMEKEKDSLSKSDAVGLKAREVALASQISENEGTLKEKEKQLELKQEACRDTGEKKKGETDREYQKEKELLSLLEQMQEEAEDMAFEEHAFFADELKEHLKEPCSFDTHLQQSEKNGQEIEKGVSVLRQAAGCERQVQEWYRQRERNQQETDAAQRKLRDLEDLQVQVQNEWKEKLYTWNGNNRELKLSAEQLSTLARLAESYDEAAGFADVRVLVADVRIGRLEELRAHRQREESVLREARQEHEAVSSELSEWENHREPEPERSESVKKNRARLKEQNIPYRELYKVLEFGQALEKTDCDRLEEALLAMGLLDALVVDEAYREQVLKVDAGCCDRYLFAGEERVEKSLLDVLNFNDSVNDMFETQRIVRILGSIAYGGEATTRISQDGTYRIGVLAGTVTGEHEAGFLGSRAREKNRQAKIAACREAIAVLNEKIADAEQELRALAEREELLAAEYAALPGEQDLQEACRMRKEMVSRIAQLTADGLRLEARLKEEQEKLQGMKKEALKIAEKLYLDCSLEVFERAETASRAYGRHIYQLKSAHELYLQIEEHLKELSERLEELDADMDQIRYDAGSTKRTLEKEREEYRSVQEQLKLTDYEEIKERLDSCIKWLNNYPEQMQRCVRQHTQELEKISRLEEERKQGQERCQEFLRRKEYLEECYRAELTLGYVSLQQALEQGIAGKVRAFLSPDCKDLEKDAVIRDLNKVYFENRAALSDYQLTQTELFGELDEKAEPGDPAAKRMDIQARDQGVRLPFHRLLAHLEEGIAQLRDLIKAGDRELFEDILSNTVSRKIRSKINGSNAWVEKMNALMGAMNTSSSLRLSLRWRSRTAESEEQLDTRELVELLKKDYRLMREEEAAKLSLHFRSKVEEARRHAKDSGGMVSFYQVMKETLDYRKWFEFQLFSQKNEERQKELTNSVFGTFSGGEKAMAMYVPLFSAVVAKYQGGRADAPRLISLDEAFAGVDNKNIRDMFRLMAEFEFDFIINSQVLWGDCDTLDALAIYQLLRLGNVKFVTVMSYLWNGKARELMESEESMETGRTGKQA